MPNIAKALHTWSSNVSRFTAEMMAALANHGKDRRPGAFPTLASPSPGSAPTIFPLPGDASRSVPRCGDYPAKENPAWSMAGSKQAVRFSLPGATAGPDSLAASAKAGEGHNNDGNDETGEQCDPPRLSQKFPAFCNENPHAGSPGASPNPRKLNDGFQENASCPTLTWSVRASMC